MITYGTHMRIDGQIVRWQKDESQTDPDRALLFEVFPAECGCYPGNTDEREHTCPHGAHWTRRAYEPYGKSVADEAGIPREALQHNQKSPRPSKEMSDTMNELAKFLLARIAEAEDAATAAVWVSDDPEWDGVDTWDVVMVRTAGGLAVAEVVGPFRKGLPMNGSDPVRVPAVAEHIALNDPARVLAECAAKRAIVERYAYLLDHGDSGDYRWVLPMLAQPDANHPDFKPEWRL